MEPDPQNVPKIKTAVKLEQKCIYTASRKVEHQVDMSHSFPPPQADARPPSQREPRELRAYGAPLGTHRYPPLPGDEIITNNNPKNQKLRASITIASLNMNGFTAPAKNLSGIEKWSTVYQTINKNKIAILALQETHLDKELLHNVHSCFGKRLHIINSPLPMNP